MNAANEKKVVKALVSIASDLKYLADGIRSKLCMKTDCFEERESPHDYCVDHVK